MSEDDQEPNPDPSSAEQLLHFARSIAKIENQHFHSAGSHKVSASALESLSLSQVSKETKTLSLVSEQRAENKVVKLFKEKSDRGKSGNKIGG